MKVKIGARLLASIKPKAKPYEVVDDALQGFTLRIQPTRVKTYYLAFRMADGHRGRMRIGDASALTPAQARDRAKQILRDVLNGVDPMAAKKAVKADTLGEFIEGEYTRTTLSNRKSGTATLDRLRACFNGFWDRKLDDSKLTCAIKNWRAKRLHDGVSKATVNRDITALKAALSEAVESGLAKTNPVAAVMPLKVDSKPKIRTLSDDEEVRLFKALSDREQRRRHERDSHNLERRSRDLPELPDLKRVAYTDYLTPMITVLLHCGLRRGEAFGIEWCDVDLGGGMLTIRGEVSKTGDSRDIPLNSTAKAVLSAWREQNTGKGLVFPSPRGAAFDNIQTAWENVLKDAGIEGFRLHDLRHTFASRCLAAGADIQTTRELLGHKKVETTARYLHSTAPAKAAAVERIVSKPSNIVSLEEAKAAR